MRRWSANRCPNGSVVEKEVPADHVPRAGEITNEDRFRSETEANGVGMRCPSRGPTAHCSDTLGGQGLSAGPTAHCRGCNRRAERRSRLWRMDRDSHRAGECRRKSTGHRLSAHSEIQGRVGGPGKQQQRSVDYSFNGRPHQRLFRCQRNGTC